MPHIKELLIENVEMQQKYLIRKVLKHQQNLFEQSAQLNVLRRTFFAYVTQITSRLKLYISLLLLLLVTQTILLVLGIYLAFSIN